MTKPLIISWHPSRPSVAVVAKAAGGATSTIWIAHYESETSPLRWERGGEGEKLKLEHPFQVSVSAMEWKPLSGSTLAVGCRDGICIWTRSRACSTGGDADLAGSDWHFRFLDSVGLSNVTALAWSPNGALLASAAQSEPRIRIWMPARHQSHAETAACTVLKIGAHTSGCMLFSGAVANVFATGGLSSQWSGLLGQAQGHHGYGKLLSWAPTGDYLFCATATTAPDTADCEIIVWETRTWNVRFACVSLAFCSMLINPSALLSERLSTRLTPSIPVGLIPPAQPLPRLSFFRSTHRVPPHPINQPINQPTRAA